MADLIDAYDAALFDLDGVVYLGPSPVDGAAEGLDALRARGVAVGFVTNNAARSAASVAEHLEHLGVHATAVDVVTSAQACARLMAEQLPSGATVLVTGTEALADEIRAVGLTVVDDWEAQPAAVVQGYDPQMTQPRLDACGFAIQRGARWFATNTDSTRPTDKGLVAGAGSQIASVRAAVTVDPTVAGKPCTPLMEETVRRLDAERPIFVGDRLDTDVEGALAVGMDSLFVFTGAHGKHDLAAAHDRARPTAIGHDLRALLAPARVATSEGDAVRCGGAVARVHDGVVSVETPGEDRESQLDALWAILQLAWQGHDATDALAQLDQVK